MSKPVIGLLGLYAGLLAILVSGCTSFPSPEGSSYGTENPAGIVSGPTRTPPSSRPSRPQSISVVDRTSSSLTVAWSAPAPSATFYAFYELHRSSSERGDYSVVASDIASAKFVDQNLEPESVYYYVVRACNKLGCSDATDEIAAGITESATAVNAPETPPFIATTGKGLTWTGVKGATYYEVYGGGNLSATVSAPKTRSPHGGGTRDFLGLFDLSGGGVYQVRACNKAGCSTMTGTSHRGQFTLSIPEMMAGVCEHGLILKPGEACQVKDDTIALVEADANGFGEHAICVGTLHKRRCDNWGAQINEGLFASQSESGKEWVVIRIISRNPDPRAEGRDPGVASIRKNQTGRVSFASVDAGQDHTCGVKSNGEVACWGANDEGQTTPRQGPFLAVSAGSAHTCGVKADGSVECWGSNSHGQASPPEGTFASVSAGRLLTCGVQTDSSVICWGGGLFSPPEGSFLSMSAGGGRHICGIRTNGFIACWGWGSDRGQTTPPEGPFSSVSSGSWHTCGIRTDGSVACWGDIEEPPTGAFSSVDSYAGHACGVKIDGTVACWSYRGRGQATPPSGYFSSVSVGTDHTCGVLTDGSVTCWGDDRHGQATPP